MSRVSPVRNRFTAGYQVTHHCALAKNRPTSGIDMNAVRRHFPGTRRIPSRMAFPMAITNCFCHVHNRTLTAEVSQRV
jgi:hypothetical protein